MQAMKSNHLWKSETIRTNNTNYFIHKKNNQRIKRMEGEGRYLILDLSGSEAFPDEEAAKQEAEGILLYIYG